MRKKYAPSYKAQNKTLSDGNEQENYYFEDSHGIGQNIYMPVSRNHLLHNNQNIVRIRCSNLKISRLHCVS